MNRKFQAEDSEPDIGPGIQEAYRLVSGEVDQLRQARRAIDLRLEKAEAAQGLLRQLLKSSVIPSVAESNSDGAKRGKRFHRGSQTFEVVTRAKKLLLEAGRPLRRSELLEKINFECGFTIRTSDPARFIGRTLWEDPDFIHIPKKGYWIVGEKIPDDNL
ncbi:hypothetical protein [Rhizobium sp. BR 315]|uniref:hypothetical protein n=1 Tax=Rhizobium sp. BR 315 TaxID=3040014 RepID=UPI003D32B7F3